MGTVDSSLKTSVPALSGTGFGLSPMAVSPRLPLIIAIVFTVVALGIFVLFCRQWAGVTFNVTLTDLASRLAPLFVAAAILERVVEIVISPWRDPGADNLQSTVNQLRSVCADPAAAASNESRLTAAINALTQYRGETQRYAFAVSMMGGMVLCIAGIRSFGPLLDEVKFGALPAVQRSFFFCIDVVLSAALLAGGADGVHSVVNAITSFFNAAADGSKTRTST